MVGVCMYTPILKNHFTMEIVHFYNANKMVFVDMFYSNFWCPNERFGTHEILSWGRGGGFKVGQISSRDIWPDRPASASTGHKPGVALLKRCCIYRLAWRLSLSDERPSCGNANCNEKFNLT